VSAGPLFSARIEQVVMALNEDQLATSALHPRQRTMALSCNSAGKTTAGLPQLGHENRTELPPPHRVQPLSAVPALGAAG
jgi:hypothetical protein